MSPALFLFELLKMGKLTRGPLVLYHLPKFVCVEVLRPSQPNGSCRARSVYLTTRLLGRLSPLSG